MIFKAMWIQKNECEDIVRSIWECPRDSSGSVYMFLRATNAGRALYTGVEKITLINLLIRSKSAL